MTEHNRAATIVASRAATTGGSLRFGSCVRRTTAAETVVFVPRGRESSREHRRRRAQTVQRLPSPDLIVIHGASFGFSGA